MKNIISVIILLTLLFSAHVYATKDKNIPVEGTWGDELVRTSAPEHPVVSIDGNLLSIYLADALENLTIVITDSNGLIVYQDCISSSGGAYTYTTWLSEQPGYYTIALTHSLGHLSGSFRIDQ
jgi:hypothetical protein